MRTLRAVWALLLRDVGWIVGTVGLAFTLVGLLEPLLKLSNLAHWVVSHWLEVTTVFWHVLLGLLHVAVPNVAAFALTVAVFHGGLLVSTRSRSSPAAAQGPARGWRLAVYLAYLPIFIACCVTAIQSLGRRTSAADPPGDAVVIASAVLIVAAPVALFALAPPRTLLRRFLLVYAAAGCTILLDKAGGWLAAAIDLGTAITPPSIR